MSKVFLLALILLTFCGISNAAISIDATASGDLAAASTVVTTSAFSTTAANELLLAFISSDSLGSAVQVNSVTGAGLTWVLVMRTNAQLGTAEIWRAFAPSPLANVTVSATLSQTVASSITVVTFTGVNSSGTNGSGAIGAVASASSASGSPSATLVTSQSSSWVLGVGTDWDNSISRTVGANQTLVQQFFSATLDTYWVQRQNAPTPNAGTSVSIDDPAPTTDRWDLSICEILSDTAPTYAAAGTITPNNSSSGTHVALGGAALQSTTVDANGNYSFSGLNNGTYTVTPSKSGFIFTPSQQTVTINNGSQTAVNFTVVPTTNNPIVVENSNPGTSAWQFTNLALSGEIEGYASATSISKGGSIALYVNSNGAAFTLDLYRLGWYQGLGGRLLYSAGTLPGQSQPTCPQDTAYGLIECKWNPTITINSNPNWTTGVYLAKVRRTDTGKDNYITFVLRDDTSSSDIIFDSNVNTMQAYNAWGGKSLYAGLNSPPQPSKSISLAAVKVSFDRPYLAFDFSAGTTTGEDDQFLRWEYQMVRFLESQGFDVSYTTNVDVSTNYPVLLQHRVYVTAGHNEYWPSSMRNNLEALANAGVSLAFFTANGSYWQVRYEPSSSSVANRVMVGFKESAPTYDPLFNDPAQSTTNFRADPINRPENVFLGAMYGDYSITADGFPFVVTDSLYPFFRNTGLSNGNSVSGLVGDEWDNTAGLPASNMPANVPGLIVLSSSPTSSSLANAVVHQTAAGGLIFDVATFQWSWGLDNTLTPGNRVDTRVAQITANVLMDMGAMPLTPSPNLVVSRAPSISGNIASTTGSATVNLSGSDTRTTTTDSQGNYVFNVLSNGTYTVTPTQAGVVFIPSSQTVTVNGTDVTGISFSTGGQTWSISGTISPTTGGSGATVKLSGSSSATVAADSSGNYSFTGLLNGSYTVTPSNTGYTFNPVNQPVTVNNGNVAAVNFTATPTYTVSGTIGGPGGNLATVTLSGSAGATVTADTSGNYSFAGLLNGSYTVTPSKPGFSYAPPSQNITVSGGNQTAVNFGTVTYSISGTIGGVGGNQATVTLSGSARATVTADTSGNYGFAGLLNGSYTVTPSKVGYAFTPTKQPVTINNGNAAAVNFTSAVAATFTISGTISGTGGNGATVTLSGAAAATTAANSSGVYSFTGLLNGSYTVAPSHTGFIFTPAGQPVTVADSNMTANFASTAQLAIDKIVSTDRSSQGSSIASPTFSTTNANELLLAFVSSDALSAGVMVTGMTGGGLTWSLVKSTNTQLGTAEIWKALAPAVLTNASVTASLSQDVAAAITVVTFIGVDTSGSDGSGAVGASDTGNGASGAPMASLVTTRNNSWVFGVGTDWDNATARTLGASQTMVHQYLATNGDTYWVQRQTSTTPFGGTTVTINDTAPTSDRWNLSIVEVLPAP